MTSELDTLRTAYGPDGNADEYFKLARQYEEKGDLESAAIAYDRAYGLAPANADIIAARKQVLDQLAVVEHGIHFRYIPAGTFLMGSDEGDPDEQPVHPVELDAFWLSD